MKIAEKEIKTTVKYWQCDCGGEMVRNTLLERARSPMHVGEIPHVYVCSTCGKRENIHHMDDRLSTGSFVFGMMSE